MLKAVAKLLFSLLVLVTIGNELARAEQFENRMLARLSRLMSNFDGSGVSVPVPFSFRTLLDYSQASEFDPGQRQYLYGASCMSGYYSPPQIGRVIQGSASPSEVLESLGWKRHFERTNRQHLARQRAMLEERITRYCSGAPLISQDDMDDAYAQFQALGCRANSGELTPEDFEKSTDSSKRFNVQDLNDQCLLSQFRRYLDQPNYVACQPNARFGNVREGRARNEYFDNGFPLPKEFRYTPQSGNCRDNSRRGTLSDRFFYEANIRIVVLNPEDLPVPIEGSLGSEEVVTINLEVLRMPEVTRLHNQQIYEVVFVGRVAADEQ